MSEQAIGQLRIIGTSDQAWSLTDNTQDVNFQGGNDAFVAAVYISETYLPLLVR